VLCMRELFRAVVKDGDITEAERLVLQNTALLLAQVKGNQWVNFTDTQGALQDFTPKQVKLLRPFLERVARDLKEHQINLDSQDDHSKEEVIDCLELAAVPWADGITARELLGCCVPDEDLLVTNKLLNQVVGRLPSKYMLQSRVRELVNYYYIKHGVQQDKASNQSEPSRCSKCVQPVLETLRRIAAAYKWIFVTAASLVAHTVVFLANCVVAFLSSLGRALQMCSAILCCCCSRRHSTIGEAEGPLLPALRFFAAAFLHGQMKHVVKFLITVMRLRVFVCLGTCNRFFGIILFPLIFLVEKVMKLNSEHTLLGCVCDENDAVSALSWVPHNAAAGLLWAVKLLRYVPLIEPVADPLIETMESLSPFISFVLDLTFSIGLAQGLSMLVDLADEQAQQKLVWMSMGIARIVREGPAPAALLPESVAAPVVASVEQGPLSEARLPIAAHDALGTIEPPTSQGGSGAVVEAPIPVWNEEGQWSIFDS